MIEAMIGPIIKFIIHAPASVAPTELLQNNTFPDDINGRNVLVYGRDWIITDGGVAP